MMYAGTRKRGFTLIEAMVYVSVLSLVAGVGILTLFAMSRNLSGLRDTSALASSASLGLERLVREIRIAEAIAEESVLGSSPGQLVLSHGTRFFLAGGELQMQQGTHPAESLLPGIVATDLVFKRIVTPQSVGVTMSVVLDGVPFRTTVALRGSY